MIKKIIDKVGKKIKLDLNYFLKSGTWTSLSMILDILLGLFLSFAIANYLDKTMAGKYFFTLSIIGIFSIFSLNGFTTIATNKFLKKDYSLYLKGTLIRIFGSIIGAFFLFIAGIYTYLKGMEIWPFLIISGIFIIGNNFNYYLKKLYSENNFKKISLYLILRSLFYYLITIYLIIFSNLELIYILSIFLLLQVLIDFIFYIIEYQDIKKLEKKNKNEKIEKKDLKDGFLFSFNELFQKISVNLDKVLIPIIFDLKLLAIYSIALIIPKSINQVFNQMSFYLFYKKLQNKTFTSVKNKVYLFIGVISLGCIFLIFILPFVFEILFPEYQESLFYTQILIFLIPINFLNSILLRLNESNSKPKSIFKVNAISQMLFIISYLILIPLIGIIGGIISRFIREIVILILYIKDFNKN